MIVYELNAPDPDQEENEIVPWCRINADTGTHPFVWFDATVPKKDAFLLAAEFDRIVIEYPAQASSDAYDGRVAPFYDICDEDRDIERPEPAAVFDAVVTLDQAWQLVTAFQRTFLAH